jgi:hypothetical protein
VRYTQNTDPNESVPAGTYDWDVTGQFPGNPATMTAQGRIHIPSPFPFWAMKEHILDKPLAKTITTGDAAFVGIVLDMVRDS